MKINQLFKTHMTDDLFYKIINCFNYSEINSNVFFSKMDLDTFDTVNRLSDLKNELKTIYLPCKSKIYMEIESSQDAITILRQVLRLFNYKLMSKQKYINNKKVIFYYIIKLLYDNVDNNVHIQQNNVKTISFT